jgi:hypothetical protein
MLDCNIIEELATMLNLVLSEERSDDSIVVSEVRVSSHNTWTGAYRQEAVEAVGGARFLVADGESRNRWRQDAGSYV